MVATRVYFIFGAILLHSITVYGEGEPCDPPQPSITPAVIPQVKPVLQRFGVTDDSSPPFADVFFKYEAQKTGDVVTVTGVSPTALINSLQPPSSGPLHGLNIVIPRTLLPHPVSRPAFTSTPSPLQQVYDMMDASFGIGVMPGSPPGTQPVTNFNQSMALLSNYANRFSLDQKLLYLSELGERLQFGYNANGTSSKTNEQIFENAVNWEHQGGICGNIHDYMADAARALGFTNAGIVSGNWDVGKSNAGHYVAYFQDPVTKNYYTDNYSALYNTNQKTLQGALDVTTRILGPLTSESIVESKPGVFHDFVPTLSRWVNTELMGATNYTPGSPVLKASVGNVENTFILQDGKELAPGIVASGFAIHSQRNEDDGNYAFDAAGAMVQSHTDYGTALNGMVNDVALESKLYAGMIGIEVPNLPGASGVPTHNTSFIGGTNIKGTAQINSVTGKLELTASTTDYEPAKMAHSGDGMPVLSGIVRLTPGVAYHDPKSNVTYVAERNLELTAANDGIISNSLRTAYDRFSVIVDNREKDPKVFISNRSDLYVFQGIGSRAATGVRDMLKAAIPAGKLGEFSVIADLSKVVSNPSQDPFYDSPLSKSLAATWRKVVLHSLEIGAGASVSNGPAPFLFTDPGTTLSPALTNDVRQVRGFVWMRSGF